MAEQQDDLRFSWSRRPNHGERVLLAMCDELIAEPLDAGFKVHYEVMDILEAIAPAASSRAEQTLEADAFLHAIIDSALNVATLRLFAFRAEEGSEELVAAIPREAVERPFTLSPPHMLETREARWRSWTRVGMGYLPERHEQEPAFVEAIKRDDPEATLLTATHNLVGNSGRLALLRRWQDLKIHALSFTEALAGEKPQDVEHLKRFLQEVREAGTSLAGTGGHVARISREELGRLLRATGAARGRLLIDARNPSCVLPLLFRQNQDYIFAPRLLEHIEGACVARFRRGGKFLSDGAGRDFELLIHRMLVARGNHGVAGAAETSGLEPYKDRGDVDSLVWNDERVLVVQTKAEMEPPGAWSTKNVKDRLRKLEGYLDRLEELRQDVSTRLADDARFWDKDRRQWVQLDQARLAGLPVRAALVSARVEPRIEKPKHPVLTAMPAKAAEVAVRRLQYAHVSAWWDMSQPIGL